jgi:hypothetical protein
METESMQARSLAQVQARARVQARLLARQRALFVPAALLNRPSPKWSLVSPPTELAPASQPLARFEVR